MARPLPTPSFRQHVGHPHELATLINRTQRRIYDRHRDAAIACAEFVRPSRAAAFSEHFQFDAKHVALWYGNILALGPTVLAALNIKRRVCVQLRGGIPGAEVDFVMHQTFGSEHAQRENTGRGPTRSHVTDLSVR